MWAGMYDHIHAPFLKYLSFMSMIMWQVLMFTCRVHFKEHFVNLLHVESYAQHGRIG